MSAPKAGFINLLREFSIPLIGGVLCALLLANLVPHQLHAIVEYGPLDGLCAGRAPGGFCISDPAGHAAGAATVDVAHTDPGAELAAAVADGSGTAHPAPHGDDPGTLKPVFGLFGHHLTLHFLINDIFMLFFFGVAAKEITESILPGGALNPPSKAVNPLLATLGGVVGPIIVYVILTHIFYGSDPATRDGVLRGWGIPTATDIALAWLTARVVFGGSHPAVNFLLLLAIADDAIGLVIIAVFYPNPLHPVAPLWLGLVALGMAIAFGLRKAKVKSWVPYIAIGGLLSWLGLLKASLHPALALVPIIPFLPWPKRDAGLFVEQSDDPEAECGLRAFEHAVKPFVDFGLFFFGLANAGVEFATIDAVTWIVFLALVIGKTVGVSTLAVVGNAVGFKYPTGMSFRHIIVAGMVAGMGLTVALFVAGEAFPIGNPHQGPAKMGALLSAFGAAIAFVAGRALNAKKLDT